MLTTSLLEISGVKFPVFPLTQWNNRLVIPLVLRSFDAMALHHIERGRLGLVLSWFEGRRVIAVECAFKTGTYSLALSCQDGVQSFQGAEIRVMDEVGCTLAVRRFKRVIDLADEPMLHMVIPVRDNQPFILH